MESASGKEIRDWVKRVRGARRKAQRIPAGQVMRPKKGRGVRYTRKQKFRKDWE